MLSRILLLFKVFKLDKSAKRFFLWAILGFAFSQSVIISTLGLMSGFEHSMKSTLNQYLPEITVRHRFDLPFSQEDLKSFDTAATRGDFYLFSILDGFLLKADEKSSAVRIYDVPRSIININFKKVGEISDDGIIIGKGLAERLGLGIGSSVSFLSQSEDQKGLSFSRRVVAGVFDFPIYEQNQRLVFSIQKSGRNYSNLIGIELPNKSIESVSQAKLELESVVDFNYEIKPFWADYEFLLEAVEVEKKSIAFVLQIIVVVAIFNVIAFLLYFKEVNNQKVFLLSAFGMSKKQRKKNWRQLVNLVWLFSCLISVFLVSVFDYGLGHLPIFKLPSEIYYFERLSIKWSFADFCIVSIFSYFILFLISGFFISKMEKSSLLSGLREEFN